MQLTFCGYSHGCHHVERSIVNALEADIINVFSGYESSKFAVLKKSDGVFVQVLRLRSDEYLLEYSDGESLGFFRSAEKVTTQEARDIFLKYLAGDDSWKMRHIWNVVEYKKPNPLVLVGVILLVLVILFLVYWPIK